jgi:hypothetical protein
MAGTPTPTQAEANAISSNLYAGLPPPTLAPDGSPLDTGSIPGVGGTATAPAEVKAEEKPAHSTHATHARASKHET